jgi:periplasmic protein TonB
LPPIGAFTSYDEEPQVIESVQPVYPPMAMQAGITGKVCVNVLIDKEGMVRDVKISKESGTNAGFEEAALEAARKTTWKPALANGQPVAVWIRYSINFILK